MKQALLAAAAVVALTAFAAAQAWLSPNAGKGRVGGISTPTIPCAAGQLDFSDATGCNLVWAGH
jgi:hypothetical protein